MKKLTELTQSQTIDKKCVVYYRVSTDPQDQDSQELEVLKYCKDNDYMIVKDFPETKSGRRYDRKVLTECIKYLYDNHIHTLIMAEISRLSRSTEGGAILHQLTRDKKCIIGIRDKVKTLDDNFQEDREMTAKALGAIEASMRESDRIGNRTSKGKKSKVFSKGIWTGGKFLPFGYVSVNKLLKLDPKEAEIAKDIFQKYYQGWGTVKIANYLNGQGIKTKLGYQWTRTTLNKLLKHRIYIGIRQYGEDSMYVQELQIIDNHIFETCQKRMTENLNTNFDFNKRKKFDFAFDKQLLKCQCGRYYYGVHRDGIFYYKCISGKGVRGWETKP